MDDLKIASLKRDVEKVLREQLAICRRMHEPVAKSLKRVTEGLEDLGMEKGFLPAQPIELKRGLTGAVAVLTLVDYVHEITVAV